MRPRHGICVLMKSLPNKTMVTTKNVLIIKDVNGGVIIEGTIYGLQDGKHGFHIHEFGDLTDGCQSLCSHFNPFDQVHGSLLSKKRHLGDLGNITSYQNKAEVKIFCKHLSLFGPFSILGRSIVVHQDEDDLGLTNHPLSQITGNSGNRMLCGIIGYASST